MLGWLKWSSTMKSFSEESDPNPRSHKIDSTNSNQLFTTINQMMRIKLLSIYKQTPRTQHSGLVSIIATGNVGLRITK